MHTATVDWLSKNGLKCDVCKEVNLTKDHR